MTRAMSNGEGDEESPMSDIPIQNEGASGSMSMADIDFLDKSPRSESNRSVTQGVEATESSDCMPTVEEAYAMNPNRSSTKKRCGVASILCAALTVIVVVSLGAGLGARGKRERSSSNAANPSGSTGQSRPTDAEPTAPAPAPRATMDEIVSWLGKEGIDKRAKLRKEGSPQNMAAVWLASADNATLPLPTVSITDQTNTAGYMYMVRYVMAVVYFQMIGENWPANLDFLSDKNVCDWWAVTVTADDPLGSKDTGLQCDDTTGLPAVLDLSTFRISLPAGLVSLDRCSDASHNHSLSLSYRRQISTTWQERFLRR
jgi:hypothetical protein